MKKIITTLLFLFLVFGCFAEGHEYTLDDLLDYCMNAPGAKLPEIGKRFKVPGGYFSVEYVNIDGDGMDYLVKNNGLKSIGYFSNLLYIYSESAQTAKTMADGFWPSLIIIQNDMEIENTGKTAPAIDAEGNRVEVPIFIGYGL